MYCRSLESCFRKKIMVALFTEDRTKISNFHHDSGPICEKNKLSRMKGGVHGLISYFSHCCDGVSTDTT